MSREINLKKSILTHILFGLFFFLILYFLKSYHYLFFHTVTEILCVVIAYAIFLFTYYSRKISSNNFFTIVGTGYFFVGTLDMLHALSYKGLDLFATGGSNLATQLWIVSRYWESLALIFGLILLSKRNAIKLSVVFFFDVCLFLAVLTSLFYYKNFPVCFIENQGLTIFKRASEYVIILILLISLLLLYRRKGIFAKNTFWLLASSIGITILAEMAFTLYQDVYGMFNFVGHLCKLLSFFLVYEAIIEHGFETPYVSLVNSFKERSQESFRLGEILRGSPDLIISFLPDGEIVYANRTAQDFFAFTKEEKVNFFNILEPNSKNLLLSQGVHSAGEKGGWQGEVYFIDKQNQAVPFIHILSAHKNKDGSVAYFSSISHNITNRKKTQERIKDLARFPEENPHPVLRIRFDGVLIYLNSSARKLLRSRGFKRNHEVPQLWLDDIRHAVAQKSILFVEKQIDQNVFSFAITPIFSQKYVNLYGIDITQRKKLEDFLRKDKTKFQEQAKEKTEQLEKAQDNLSEIQRLFDIDTQELQRTKEELKKTKRLSDIGTLAATVAHELRNPLGVIRTAVYNIGQKRTNPSIDKQLNNIEQKILEGNQIISNLLHYSRLKMPKYEKINIAKVLLESIQNTKERFHNMDVTVHCNVPEKFMIEADPFQLSEVFDNILNNAYQAVVDKEGIIEVSLEYSHLDNQAVNIQFCDNGEGIDKNLLNQIFNPFFTTRSKGTGLGLTICNEIIDLHGGEIDIQSEKEKGTIITIMLPRKRNYYGSSSEEKNFID